MNTSTPIFKIYIIINQILKYPILVSKTTSLKPVCGCKLTVILGALREIDKN